MKSSKLEGTNAAIFRSLALEQQGQEIGAAATLPGPTFSKTMTPNGLDAHIVDIGDPIPN
jgi:hypothetical protein